MISVRNLRASGRFFSISVVTPVLPGAMLFFIMLIMVLIAFMFGATPSSGWLEFLVNFINYVWVIGSILIEDFAVVVTKDVGIFFVGCCIFSLFTCKTFWFECLVVSIEAFNKLEDCVPCTFQVSSKVFALTLIGKLSLPASFCFPLCSLEFGPGCSEVVSAFICLVGEGDFKGSVMVFD